MLLTLNAAALRSRLILGSPSAAGGGPGKLRVTDVPALAKQELGVNGLVVSTDLLVGADRQSLQKLLEAADKAGCPCLVLMETTPQHLCADDVQVSNAAADRCLRVAQAAAWLGCSAFSIPIEARDDDDELLATSVALKPISRRSEKLDLNLCIAPRAGLTATPERVTELLKKIGGFRVGTLPDFAGAAASPDPVQYLRRLVPYGSAVLVPAVEGDIAEPADAGKKKPAKAASAKPAAKGKPKKKKADDDEGDDEAGDPEATVAAVSGSYSGGYDIITFAKVLEAVGYEGPVALDYRGTGEAMPALLKTRDTLVKLFQTAPPAAEETGLSALLAAVEGDDGGAELDEEQEEGEDGGTADE